jgi:hypothetical protein
MAGSGRQNADPALIAALVGGATAVEAARKAGVSERTAYRRLGDAAFRARLDAAHGELIDAAARALAAHLEEAVETLVDLNRDAPSSIRLGAARTILELGPHWRARRLEKRIAELERSKAEQKKDG